ncbi:MAG: glycosyltransferase family 39 protein [Anaerolineae bacterium]|nr:glycosyltransferase family 39 protein [Anaerolineae bacterium]
MAKRTRQTCWWRSPRLVEVVLFLTWLAWGLRLYRFDFQPLWGDEGWSFYFAGMALPEMVQHTAQDIHPPLYYALLHIWLALTASTPEGARLFSIVVGTLLLPMIWRLGALLLDRRAALLGSVLTAFAPLGVYYSQEVRMYMLVTLLGAASLYSFARLVAVASEGADGQSDSRRWRLGWLLSYVLATTAALYTMYYAALLLLAQGIWLAIYWVMRRCVDQVHSHDPSKRHENPPEGWRRGIWGVGIAAGLYIPWVLYAAQQLWRYVQGKRAAEQYLPLDMPHYLSAHLAAFSTGHLSEALVILRWATVIFGLLAGLGLLYSVQRRRLASGSLLFCALVVPLIGGFAVNLAYPFTPRYFERTLLVAAPVWWLLVAAGWMWLWRYARALFFGAGILMVASGSVALADFYTVPRYRDEDYRPLLRYVRTHSSAEDVILASYQWQLGLYRAYLPAPHPCFFVVPGWGKVWADDPQRMRTDLLTLLEEHPRLWFPAYQVLGRLWETRVEALLNQIAFPAEVNWSLPGTKLILYGRGDALQEVTPQLIQSARPGMPNFGGLIALERARVGGAPLESGRGVLPVVLFWRRPEQTTDTAEELRVALRLVDAAGQRWAGRDSRPLGGQSSFRLLAPGSTLIDHHGILIPAGTPPGTYQLRLGLVRERDGRPLDVLDEQGQPQGSEVILGNVQVMLPPQPLPPEALPIQHPLRADFAGGVRLLGYSIGAMPVKAGEILSFSLFWQALAAPQARYVVFAQLQDATGQPLALSETPPVYPSEQWVAGILLRDPHQILLPPELPSGEYWLAVGLLRPGGTRVPVEGDDQVILTRIYTTQRARQFTPPLFSEHFEAAEAHFGAYARLLGYELNLPEVVSPGTNLELVLYWQALQPSPQRYSVFVHLIDAQDRIFGQHDQEPGGGQFPTTSWVSGEYLVDHYQVPVHPGTPPGMYRLEVGLYDPLSGQRLEVRDADGRVLGNRLLLEKSPVRVR